MNEFAYQLSPLFFAIAVIYSMVGFGGGSSYIALLILWGVSYTVVPSVALVCNAIVVSGSTVNFVRHRHLDFKFTAPFILLSIPLSYIGGSIPVSKVTFQLLLGATLFAASLRMMFFSKKKFNYRSKGQSPPFSVSCSLGGGLGLVSGVVGIGGGIFLAPILYWLRWGNPQKIAATSSLFILLNSLAGLAGQLQKIPQPGVLVATLPLFLSVLAGGQLGNRLCIFKIEERRIEILTSILILFVSLRLVTASL